MGHRLVDVMTRLVALVGDQADSWRVARSLAARRRLIPAETLRRVSVELGDDWADELYRRLLFQPAEIDVEDITHVGHEESTLGWLLSQLIALHDAEPGAAFMRVAIGRREVDLAGVSVVRRGADAVVLIR